MLVFSMGKILRFDGAKLEESAARLRRAGRDAKLCGAYVRVRTVLSGNERLTLTISRLIV
jgi:hypothetical protein